LIPAFYGLLQAQDFHKQSEQSQKLRDEIDKLVDACDREGPFFLGPELSWVDIFFAPWMLRLSRVLKPYRGWPDPVPGTRWAMWVDAVERNEFVRNTTSSDDLYVESYERYARNRPGTSLLADAINAGMGLP
jgi:glutathione S-transferase